MTPRVSVPEGQKGRYKVERFKTEHIDFGALKHGRDVPMGETFTRLRRDNGKGDFESWGAKTVMSDTPAEYRDHTFFIHWCQGHVLIAGLGIGLVLQEVAKKKEVTMVTVVEIEQDVIDLVWPHYQKMFGKKIEVVCADIFEWKPPKGIKYDSAWYDVWDDICSDNLESMKKLHRKFAKRTGFQASWSREQCEYLKRCGR